MPANLPFIKRSYQLIKSHAIEISYLLFWLFYFAYFWSHAITPDELGGMEVSHVSIWGDWAAHFTMGSAMVERGLILSSSPFLLGAHFSYPFFTNAISALLIKMGAPFFSAFVVPSFLFSLMFVGVLFWFYRRLFTSAKIALLASVIFLCNGGTGFIYYIQDIVTSNNPWFIALNPPQEYTSMQDHFIRWISVVNSQLIPQRAFTLGFPLALIALSLVWHNAFSKKSPAFAFWTAAALLAILPIIHTHSFLASGIILACWMVGRVGIATKAKKLHTFGRWLGLAGVVSLGAIPLLALYFFSNVSSSSFIRWFPGWYLQEFDVNWFEFWFRNWGVVPILALAGMAIMVRQQKSSSAKLSVLFYFLPFFAIFALVNLFLFQPFIWDNTKLLSWASVGFSGLAAVTLAQLWNSASKPALRQTLLKLAAALIFCLTIFSGTIDLWRIIRFDIHTFQMYSQTDLQLTDWVKQNTTSDSVWLTGDMHNTWLFNLTGRQPLLTFRGWLWTHGYDYYQIETDAREMFQHPAASTDLFAKYGIDYILVGPNEREVWGANEAEIQEIFPVAIALGESTIFRVNSN